MKEVSRFRYSVPPLASAFLLIFLLFGNSNGHAQVVGHFNQVTGTVELTNAHPDILDYIESNPYNEAIVYAESTDHTPQLAANSSANLDSPTQGTYQITVEAGPPGDGISYRLRARLRGGHDFWFDWAEAGAVEEEPAPDIELNFSTCAAFFRVYFVDEDGNPVTVRHPRFHFDRETSPGSGSYQVFFSTYNNHGSESLSLAPTHDALSLKTRIRYQALGDDDTTWVWQTYSHTEMMTCDSIRDITLTVIPPPIAPSPEPGRITGLVDVVGEDEVRDSFNNYAGWIPRPHPSNFDVAVNPGRHNVRTQYYLRTDWDHTFFHAPRFYDIEVSEGQTVDLGTAFRIEPGYVRGDIELAGPFPPSGSESCLDSLYRFVDVNDDGIPDSQGFTSSILQANGVNIVAPGATLSARGGYSQTYFQGDYQSESASFLGSYEHVLGGLYGESSYWRPAYLRLNTRDVSTPQLPDSYHQNRMWITNQQQEDVLVNPGEATEVPWNVCVSQVRLGFAAFGGEFYSPFLTGAGSFDGTDYNGNPAAYAMSSLEAWGTPATLGDAAATGQVNLCLPQGDYSFTPYVTAVNPDGSTSRLELQPVGFSVGCRQILDLRADIQAEIDEIPACSTSEQLTVTGSATASDTVDLLSASVNGSAFTVCESCGDTVDFAFDTPLAACSNEISVTAEDRLGSSATATAFTRFDFDPPQLTGCQDIEVTIDPESPGADIDFGIQATDGCDGNRPLVCSRDLDEPFAPGTTTVSCTAADVCGNVTSCSFDVTVNNGSTSECVEDDFDGTVLDPQWQLANLGDADQGSVQLIRDELHVRGDGTSLFHDDDNAAFVYREASGDFRVSVDVVDIPADQGGLVRKAALMVRSGIGPRDPRVMVTYVPHFPTDPETTALQFDFRDTDGNAYELAGRDLDISLPVRLAIERRGNRFTVTYSTDGGVTWVQPQGDFGGTIDLDMGDDVVAGMAVSSYDAETVMTAAFDDFSLCAPNGGGPIDPGDPTPCDQQQALDVIYLVDRSSSMTHQYGSMGRFEATRQALRDVNDLLSQQEVQHRAALLTFGGTLDGDVPPVTTHSGLTADLDGITALIEGLEPPTPTPLHTTPTARALRSSLELLLSEHQVGNQPVIVWFTDGVPNMDILGRGPEAYSLEEIQALRLIDESGDFRSWGEVAWSGHFNVDTGTYDGEPMANAMYEIELLRSTFGNLLMYGIALQGDGVDFGTFNEDLLAYGAYATGTPFFSTDSLPALTQSMHSLLDELVCGEPATALIGDRLWSDLDQDGVQDGDEIGLEGVTLELLDGMGNVVADTVTGANGSFLFADLTPGTWTVRVDAATLPGDFEATHDADGIDSPHQATIEAGAWDVHRAVDFGYFEVPPDPLADCLIDDFEDGVLDEAWSTLHVGDATLGSVTEQGGRLEIASDGSALWNDDHYFHAYHDVSGNFRVEVDITDVLEDAGGTFRKAGIIVSPGGDPRSPRVMAMLVPHFPNPDRPVLQFGYRDSDGGGGQVLAEVVSLFAPLPIRLAIEKVDNTYTVYYSTNGGVSWIQPTEGGVGGSVTFDMGDDLRVGLGASSYETGTLFRVAFDDVLLCPLDP